MLRLDAVEASIGPVRVLRGVTLEVPSGTVCGLIGRNGAGKTSVMRAVMGFLPLRAGAIRLGRTDLSAVRPHGRPRLGIGYLPEDRRLVPGLTAEDNVRLPAWATGAADPEARLERVYRLLPEVRALAPRRTVQLSGGQQKLVALARAMVCGTSLLLLDEPFEGVAPALACRLAEVLRAVRRDGVTVLLAESDERRAAGLLDRVFVIERGAVEPG